MATFLARWAPVGAVVVIVAGAVMTASVARETFDRCVHLELKVEALEMMHDLDRRYHELQSIDLRGRIQRLEAEIERVKGAK